MRFQIRSSPDWVATIKPGQVEADDHAFLLGEPPPPDTIITLHPETLLESQPAHSLQITILVDGKRRESVVLTTFDQPIPLWPLDREGGIDSP